MTTTIERRPSGRTRPSHSARPTTAPGGRRGRHRPPQARRRRPAAPPRRAATRNRRRRPPRVWRTGDPQRRVLAVFVVCAVVLVLMVVRVATLQTVDRKTYAGWGESKRLSTRTLAADRGTIYDRNRLELAISAPQTTLWADPRLIKDDKRDAVVDQIAAVLGMDAAAADRVRQAIAKGGQFAYVARQVDDGLAKQVLDLKLPGIASYVEPRRFNPGELAQATVGRTDLDGLGADGSGIEKMYDDVLTGVPGHTQREVDVRGRTIPMGRHEVSAAVPGKSVVLTVDSTLTYEVEQMLLDHLNSIAVNGRTPKGGMVTVMDRATGDLLVTASVSTDPTTGKLQINQGANRPFIEAFEPGSVMKIVAAAGALDSGVSTLEQSWHLEARLTSGVDEIHNAEENMGGGDLTLRDIVVESSNVGTVRLAQEVGTSHFESYLHGFGFGAKTPIGFPDESKGILPPSSKWYGSQKDTIAYGQGVSVTQVQMAAAMNTLANGGQYVAPRLVSATIDPDGTVRPAADSPKHRVISEQAAADLTDALRGVVCDKRGTVGSHREKYLNLANYAVAGKTGTAFKAQNKNYVVGYEKGRKKIDNYRDELGNKHYMASFAGFLPAENPRLTIAVTIDEPTEEFRFGASSAAPLFAKIGAESMRLLGVPPSPGGSGCPPTS